MTGTLQTNWAAGRVTSATVEVESQTHYWSSVTPRRILSWNIPAMNVLSLRQMSLKCNSCICFHITRTHQSLQFWQITVYWRFDLLYFGMRKLLKMAPSFGFYRVFHVYVSQTLAGVSFCSTLYNTILHNAPSNGLKKFHQYAVLIKTKTNLLQYIISTSTL